VSIFIGNDPGGMEGIVLLIVKFEFCIDGLQKGCEASDGNSSASIRLIDGLMLMGKVKQNKIRFIDQSGCW
jgi:hypothetical protein